MLFRATPAAYGGSQARGLTGATAAGLHHSHSNLGSKTCLQHIPQLMAILRSFNPLSKARDGTHILMVTSQVRYHWTTMGIPWMKLILKQQCSQELEKNIFFFFFFFVFFRLPPVAYVGSQARGLIGATAASLRHSHSNARSEPRL